VRFCDCSGQTAYKTITLQGFDAFGGYNEQVRRGIGGVSVVSVVNRVRNNNKAARMEI
jgi:hypothetical protein